MFSEFETFTHRNLSSSDIPQISFRIEFEVVGHGQPDGSFPHQQVVFVDDRCNRAAFANTGTVAWR